jgi:hypothetical protein
LAGGKLLSLCQKIVGDVELLSMAAMAASLSLSPGPQVGWLPLRWFAQNRRPPIETWMKLVIAATAAFLLALLVNQVETLVLAATATHPEVPHWLDQRYLFLGAWGFPVLAVWGFNARWLPVFLGLREPSSRALMAGVTDPSLYRITTYFETTPSHAG